MRSSSVVWKTWPRQRRSSMIASAATPRRIEAAKLPGRGTIRGPSGPSDASAMGRRRRRHEQPLRFDFAPPPPPPPREARRRRIRWIRFGLVLALLTLLAFVSSLFGFLTAVAQNAPNLDQFTAR